MNTFILFAVLLLGICNIYHARSMPTTDREAVEQLLERQFSEIEVDGVEKVLGSQPNEYQSTWNSYASRTKNKPICSGSMEGRYHVIRLVPKKTQNCIQRECNGIMVESRIILTAAHCLYGDAPEHGKRTVKKIDCPENCWTARGSNGQIRDVAYVMRHAGYKQHITKEVAGIYRHDIAVVILKSPLPIPVTSSEIGCIVAGKCADPKTESCWMHRFDTNTLQFRKDPISVDRCSGIDYSASDCSQDDTLCIFDRSGKYLLAEKGDSGSPIVCEETVGGQKFFYVRGVLSQKRRDDKYLLLASADQVNRMDYRGCVEY